MPRFTPRLKKYLVSSIGDKSQSDGDAPVQPSADGIGMRHAQAKERVERRANLLIQSRFRAKRVETDMHADIGSLLDGMAGVHKLSAVHVLGLASKVKSMLETSDAMAELVAEGSRLYLEERRPTSSLTIVGDLPDRSVEAELRAIGFTRAGKQWAGPADVAEAVSLARKHNLSLLRYSDDHMPQFFLRKGQDQPALEELMEEARRQEAETEAFLAAVVNGRFDSAEEDAGIVEEPSIGTAPVEPSLPVVHDGAEHIDDDIPPVTRAPLVAESTKEPKPPQVQVGFKRPGRPHAG